MLRAACDGPRSQRSEYDGGSDRSGWDSRDSDSAMASQALYVFSPAFGFRRLPAYAFDCDTQESKTVELSCRSSGRIVGSGVGCINPPEPCPREAIPFSRGRRHVSVCMRFATRRSDRRHCGDVSDCCYVSGAPTAISEGILLRGYRVCTNKPYGVDVMAVSWPVRPAGRRIARFSGPRFATASAVSWLTYSGRCDGARVCRRRDSSAVWRQDLHPH